MHYFVFFVQNAPHNLDSPPYPLPLNVQCTEYVDGPYLLMILWVFANEISFRIHMTSDKTCNTVREAKILQKLLSDDLVSLGTNISHGRERFVESDQMADVVKENPQNDLIGKSISLG